MFSFSFSLTGVDVIKEAFNKLEKTEAKRVIRQAVRLGIKEVAKEIRASIPKKTGELRKAITVRAIKSRKGIGSRVYINPDKIDLEKHGGFFYPAAVEFGHGNVPPQPVFRQTYLKLQQRVRQMMKDYILNQIKLTK